MIGPGVNFHIRASQLRFARVLIGKTNPLLSRALGYVIYTKWEDYL